MTVTNPWTNRRRITDIDWAAWTPVDRATLLFIIRAEKILLIRKKRGLGAGKINGPGGRIETGETPLEGAIREVEEEVGLIPTDVTDCGELRFQFVDGYSLHVWVFRAAGYIGELKETDEACPMWVPIDVIPYSEMWADDQVWLPMLLREEAFSGRFIFDKDQMIDYAI